jgi:hypothetical protein
LARKLKKTAFMGPVAGVPRKANAQGTLIDTSTRSAVENNDLYNSKVISFVQPAEKIFEYYEPRKTARLPSAQYF